MLPLTVDGLFLEMGRLFSQAAVWVPLAQPASAPLTAALKGPHPVWGGLAPHNRGGKGGASVPMPGSLF